MSNSCVEEFSVKIDASQRPVNGISPLLRHDKESQNHHIILSLAKADFQF